MYCQSASQNLQINPRWDVIWGGPTTLFMLASAKFNCEPVPESSRYYCTCWKIINFLINLVIITDISSFVKQAFIFFPKTLLSLLCWKI